MGPAAPVAAPTACPKRGLELAAWLALAALLIVQAPLFLRTPLHRDVTFSDICAHDILRGGAPERDFLILQPPGVFWAMALVRATFGDSDLAPRIADLLVLGLVVWLLCRYLAAMGLSRAGRAGAALAMVAFYLSTGEWVHGQPDCWMLLPATAALCLRRRAVDALARAAPRSTWWSLLEGVLWGAGCLVKPYVVVPALLTWLVSAALVRGTAAGWRGCFARDMLALLAGGLLMGALWQGWLLRSGSWASYWDNMAEFGGDYGSAAPTWPNRFKGLLIHLKPWSLLNLPAVLIALVALLGGVLRPRHRMTNRDRAGALLGTFYLGWWMEANFLQYQFHYHLAPGLIVALAVLAAWLGRWRRPAWGWAGLLGFVSIAVVLAGLGAFRPKWLHDFRPDWQGAFRPDRLALWGRCWRGGEDPELKERLALAPEKPVWTELAQVRDYLRGQGVGDGELLCYSFQTPSLYTDLGVRPSCRFIFPKTSLWLFRAHQAALFKELQAGPQHYIVTEAEEAHNLEAQLTRLAAADTSADARPWPYSEPLVFQAGRYVVHRARGTADCPPPP